MTRLRIAVVSGGRSSEAEVSRASAAQVLAALRRAGHQCTELDCDEELWEALRHGRYDVAFLVLHGRYGEDGTVQGVCELLDVPYTGSDALASALCFHKAMAKRVMLAAGIPTPPWHVVARTLSPAEAMTAMRRAAADLGYPMIVKPVRSGSTIGLSRVEEQAQLEAAFTEAAWHDDVLCERFVAGTEVTVGILGHNPARALPTLEIVSHRPLYDYAAKYTVGQSEHIVPARLPPNQRRRVEKVALAAHHALGCRAISRVDLVVDARGDPWVLEVNTIPGLTELSLLPDAARAAGISFDEICETLLTDALARHREGRPRGGRSRADRR